MGHDLKTVVIKTKLMKSIWIKNETKFNAYSTNTQHTSQPKNSSLMAGEIKNFKNKKK